jgi:hypothetical protein
MEDQCKVEEVEECEDTTEETCNIVEDSECETVTEKVCDNVKNKICSGNRKGVGSPERKVEFLVRTQNIFHQARAFAEESGCQINIYNNNLVRLWLLTNKNSSSRRSKRQIFPPMACNTKNFQVSFLASMFLCFIRLLRTALQIRKTV